MPNVLRALRSMVAGNRPTGRSYGELYTNLADNQFGMVNNAGTAQDLLAVRNFSTTANYALNDLVVQGGNLVQANRAVTAGAYNVQNFTGVRRNRNKIINGSLMLDQYWWHTVNANQNLAVAVPVPGPCRWMSCDRWQVWQEGTTPTQTTNFSTVCGTPNYNQLLGVVPPLAGAGGYLRFRNNSAVTVVAGIGNQVGQSISIWDHADLQWGTSQAQPATLSFWVHASVAGTYGGALIQNAWTRAMAFSYSVPTANTWTYCVVSIPGDTNTIWLTDATTNQNQFGLWVCFDLGSGASKRIAPGTWTTFANTQTTCTGATGTVSWLANNGATLTFANVQFEAGSIATPFEWKNTSDNYAECQRYYQTFNITLMPVYPTTSGATGNAFVNCYTALPVVMRCPPTIMFDDGYGNFNTFYLNVYGQGGVAAQGVYGGAFTSGGGVLVGNFSLGWPGVISAAGAVYLIAE